MNIAKFVNVVLGFVFASVTCLASAQPVANCSNPEGYAYYHYHGVVPKDKSGFQRDKISGGVTTIQRLQNGEFDILMVDARKQVISMTQDGGKVVLMRRGGRDATFLLFFPGNAIELYSIWIDIDGRAKFSIISSKGGREALVHKGSVLVGDCEFINFGLMG